MSELLAMAPFWALVIIGMLIVFSVIILVFSYLKNRSLEQIRENVYQLILKAEHVFTESSAGKQKMKWVIQEARKLLPGWLQLVLSDAALEKVIQVWFNGIKDLLDDGKVNGSQG
ncbi:MAG: hypothetical protein Q4C61_16215 [Lachnospiraceae bacterium]|nr:hypothetical protein [Lachnospiraceae bacterium]